VSERPADGHAGDGQGGQRQFVKFSFFSVDPAFRRLPVGEREAAVRAFTEAVESCAQRMLVRSYSLVGIRGDCDFLVWQVSDGLDDFQTLATAALTTPLGSYLSQPHSYLSLTRRSIYKTPLEAGGRDSRLTLHPSDSKYLFVYPFVKTRAWYELSKDERQQMMNEHITIGRKYPSVKLNTTYSYGLDDQEFVVAFETDQPADFLDLVMELRETRASSYTLRDTPAFTCVATPLAEILASLAGLGEGRVEPAATGARTAAGWSRVATAGDVPPGSSKVVHMEGEPVAVFNVAGRYYALGNRCSHANGPLCEGEVTDSTVTCPWHASSFDLVTGEPTGGPAQRPVPAYEARVEDGAVLLRRAAASAIT
jgi:chlorite dismutase